MEKQNISEKCHAEDKLSELLSRYPALTVCQDDLRKAAGAMETCYRRGGKILLCGNGGSAADCEHIVGELMKGFLTCRPLSGALPNALRARYGAEGQTLAEGLQGSLPAISLPSQCAILTAFINDVSAENVYAQLVSGYGKPGDLLIAISTSGNSKNIVNAARVAVAMGLSTLALTGASGGALASLCEVTVRVPTTETFKVQEYHLPVYHYLCAETERRFFPETN